MLLLSAVTLSVMTMLTPITSSMIIITISAAIRIPPQKPTARTIRSSSSPWFSTLLLTAKLPSTNIPAPIPVWSFRPLSAASPLPVSRVMLSTAPMLLLLHCLPAWQNWAAMRSMVHPSSHLLLFRPPLPLSANMPLSSAAAWNLSPFLPLLNPSATVLSMAVLLWLMYTSGKAYRPLAAMPLKIRRWPQ